MHAVKSLIWFNYIFLKEVIIRNYKNRCEKSKIELKREYGIKIEKKKSRK